MRADRLLEIFNRMLEQTENLSESAAEFIRRVASTYSLEIQEKGEIPHFFVEDVLADLEAEVLEMYRKTTYGFFSLKDYREMRGGKSPRKNSQKNSNK